MEFECDEHKSRLNKAKHGIDFVDALITYRNSRIRLISVRRSRPEEVALYEGQELRSQIR